MKYTFINRGGNQQTVEIDDSWIAKNCKLLGITKREAIEMWLSDEGYIDNEVVAELTAAAKANKTGVQGASTKPRKRPERKPDYTKRALIDGIKEFFLEQEFADFKVKDVEVTNVERMIAFSIGDDKYEVTLTKKRKPKD